MTEFAFQNPAAIVLGVIVVVATMVWWVIRFRRSGLSPRRVATLVALRGSLLAALFFLAARPVWTSPDPQDEVRDHVALLIDRSESMSVLEGDRTRYEQAVQFARDVLLPAVDQSRLQVRPVLFSDQARVVSGQEIATATPDGSATNLGRALVQTVLANERPPLVAIALTDGIVTHVGDHSRAAAALVTHAVPMVGIGFGSQSGGRVVSLDEVDAPALAEPGQRFRVTARLSATGFSIPPLDLLLMRDGQLADRRKIAGIDGPRTWIESFDVQEDATGVHSYSVRVMPPSDRSVTIARAEAATMVRVISTNEIRVLYVQGGLTWDYKFANIAVAKDPTIKLSGLSRTASTSKFFENVHSDVDLVNGFPSTLEKLSEFRVVVLSNLRPGDLTPHQQQLLADFCGNLGGGLLMIGGPQTFNASWRDSRLEDLLPVRFAVLADRGLNQRFRLQPSPTALQHPVFQISDTATASAAWQDLPQFTHRAVVEGVKPGAQIWLQDGGGAVLMASQRYGNGFAAVICMQNLWKWRLARDSNPEHFDRFWTQLLRYLAEAGREVYAITPTNLQPAPGEQIGLLVDHRSAAGEQSHDRVRVRLTVMDSQQREALNQQIELQRGRQVAISFTPETAGLYSATLVDAADQLLASREIDVREMAAELASTSRNMETLRQFAGISGGSAVEAEASNDITNLLNQYLQPEQTPSVNASYALPAGINGWMLTFLLACMSAEYLCRKRWNLL